MAPRANVAHIGYIAASAGDIASTQRALRAGAVEMNPLLGSNPNIEKLVGIKVAGWAGLRAFEGVLERHVERPLKWWEQATRLGGSYRCDGLGDGAQQRRIPTTRVAAQAGSGSIVGRRAALAQRSWSSSEAVSGDDGCAGIRYKYPQRT